LTRLTFLCRSVLHAMATNACNFVIVRHGKVDTQFQVRWANLYSGFTWLRFYRLTRSLLHRTTSGSVEKKYF